MDMPRGSAATSFPVPEKRGTGYIANMKTRRALIGLALATPLWTMAAADTGTQPASAIGLQCTGKGDATLHGAVCAQLHTVLAAQHPDRSFVLSPAATTVTLHLDQASATHLVGHLAWTGPRPGQGPDVTAGIQDGTIAHRQINMLIVALLKATNLPL